MIGDWMLSTPIATDAVRPASTRAATPLIGDFLLSTPMAIDAPAATPSLQDPTPPAAAAAAAAAAAPFAETTVADHAWRQTNHIWSEEELDRVTATSHAPVTASDYATKGFMNVLYHGFNFITGYDHEDPSPSSVAWRLIILESFAGVPGFVAAGFRHFYSLRELKRDHGAIFTFLEEAENERMHLLVCMKMFEASPATRALVVAAQFTMTPLLCATYAASPRAMHRFVGYLEETAVMTYANLVEKAATPGTRLHGAWAGLDAPDIAKSYWKLDDDASWAECLRHMLADESHHRDVNHAFAELPRDAENPFIGDHMRDFDKAATAHAAAKHRE